MTSFIVMDVLERANELQKQGVDIIHLEVGEPDRRSSVLLVDLYVSLFIFSLSSCKDNSF